jgi:2-haloacid dehalogenase
LLNRPQYFMKKIQDHCPAIVFDFGGVLFDWDPRYLYRQYFPGNEQAMENFLGEIQFDEWNRQQDVGRPFSEAVIELSQQFPQYAGLIKVFDTRWEETLAGVFPQSVAILEYLYQAGYPLYALSNWSVEKFRIVRPRYDFLNWFETIVISGEARLAKPDPEIFRYFLNTTQREPGECLFIDDAAVNIAVARELGFQTLRFQTPEILALDLKTAGILAS